MYIWCVDYRKAFKVILIYTIRQTSENSKIITFVCFLFFFYHLFILYKKGYKNILFVIITYQYYQTKLLKKGRIIIVLIIYIRLVWVLNIYIHKQHCMYWKKDLRCISGFYEIKMLHVSCTCICVYQWKKNEKNA